MYTELLTLTDGRNNTIKSTFMQAVSWSYMKKLTGPYGLYQHAHGFEPNLSEGYCTDDNSRAIRLCALRQWNKEDEEFKQNKKLYWQFLKEAQNQDGSFKNFRDVKGKWLDDIGTEETHSHAARALGTVIKYEDNLEIKNEAQMMMRKLLPRLGKLEHPRSAAETILALHEWNHQDGQEVMQSLYKILLGHFKKNKQKDWPWFEQRMTYANALFPHAVLAYNQAFPNDQESQEILLATLPFLIKTTIKPRFFQPVGNKGWYARGQKLSMYDQQPLDAALMFELLLAYDEIVANVLSPEIISAPYLWFWGRNSLGLALRENNGACHDGLNADGVNLNCGAESTLAYLLTEIFFQLAPASVKQAARVWQESLVV